MFLKICSNGFSECNLKLLSTSKCDVMSFYLLYRGTKTRFILVYRPPSSCFDSRELLTCTLALHDLLINIAEPNCENVLLGDFNLPDMNWIIPEAKLDGVHDLLLNCFSSLGLTQFVSQPTRFCNSGRGNILDIILSDNHLLVDIVEHHPPLGTSDHSMIEFRMFSPDGGPTQSHPCDAPDHITLPVYDWNAGNYDAINAAIDDTDWNLLFGYSFDSDSLWSGFKTIIWAIIDAFVPKKSVNHFDKYKTRTYPKFIRRLLSRKKAIWRQLKLQFNPVLHDKYKQIAKECCDAILKFDIDRENRMLQTNNLGVFYKFVNNKLRNRSGIAPLKDANGNLLMNDDEKANLLNSYFHSAFTIDNGTLPNFPSRFNNDIHTSPHLLLFPRFLNQLYLTFKSHLLLLKPYFED